MNKPWLPLFVLIAGLVCGGAALAVDTDPGRLYLVPGIGMIHTDSDLQADDDAAFSLRLGKQLSQHWDVQLGTSHARADEDGAFTSGNYKQTLLGVDALYLFSRERFRPFVLAGFGAARNRVGYSLAAGQNETQTSWMANVGVGLQMALTDTWGLQADVRHVWSRAEATGVFGAANAHDEKTIGNTYLNFGLVFSFDPPKTTVASARPAVVEDQPAPRQEQVAAAADDAGAQSDQAQADAADKAEQTAPADGAAVAADSREPPAFAKVSLQAEVLFDFDRDGLRSTGKQALDTEVVAKMQAHPEVELVLVTGHTDLIGSDAYNQNLSERRAASVKRYLISQGIAESRLHAVGKGETEPVHFCHGVRGKRLIECLQPNRRVVVEIEVQRPAAN